MIPFEENILDSDFTVDEILRLATNIEIDQSSGIPELDSKIFKDIIQIFPGSLQNVSNWRPISILPIQGKILEHLIHKQIMLFLVDNKIINEHQFGFMPGKPTSHAIFNVTKYSYDTINKGNICGCICIDMSKAFGSVYHPRLLLKFESLGLVEIFLNWFKSYLVRAQNVLFSGIKSNT